jgi:processive 1,2-diacylglycerol beta-glucosyltransferase
MPPSAPRPPRVLVLSASAGAGHLRAAEAVARAVHLADPGVEVRNLDVLTLASPAFRKAYSEWYLSLVGLAPGLWGYLYERLDGPPRHHPVSLRRALDQWNTRALVSEAKAFAPDAIVCTHFLPAATFSAERRRGRCAGRIGVVVTDADVHRLWIHEGVDRYFVARAEAGAHLEALGQTAVEDCGIPIDPRFGTAIDRVAIRQKHGLPAHGAVVLLLGGGFGVGSVAEMAQRLEDARAPVAIVVVAGRNEELRRTLEESAGPRTRVLGFTTEIDEWMAAADLLVTKPGGLTTAEALARGLPMVLVNPIPGQEQRNADALLETGAAVRANTPAVLGWKVDALLADEARLARMRAAAQGAARPHAALCVARWALGGG